MLGSEFVLIYSCYLFSCLAYFRAGAADYLLNDNGLLRILLVALSILFGLYLNQLYDKGRLTSRKSLLLQLCNVFGIAFIVQGLLGYLGEGLRLPRLVMIAGTASCLGALLLWRIFYSGYVWKLFGTNQVVFLGTSEVVQEIAGEILARPELGMSVAGYVDDDCKPGSLMVGGAVLGPASELKRIADRVKPRRIIVGMADWRNRLPIKSLLEISASGIVIQEAAAAYEETCGRVCSREFRPSQIIFDNELRSRPGSVALQSVYTNLIAIVSIALSLPVFIAIGIALKAGSRGRVLTAEERVGFNGLRFKLRSFRVLGPDLLPTPFGGWLRRTHLENLPYLFNVLRGEMALVGPTPERPEFVGVLMQYFPFYQQRHTVKPGITGWSRLQEGLNRSRLNSLAGLEYDLYYTKHISLALDMYILFHWLRSRWPF
ncbi:MAG: sugar transferase [Acidobacteriota bacterium]|nr:sugar transferase [Acidobacteriota bacterium]